MTDIQDYIDIIQANYINLFDRRIAEAEDKIDSLRKEIGSWTELKQAYIEKGKL